ncbi:hypothetical protein [Mycolicibacterium sp. CBMA 361]|uniref:hypothetical protein n=1 Tax=Mycolicibacterium sp. CBMA 361 TaxID=2606610 RepID=UPI001EEFC2F3|nr:hypothetical protein [Mycolicibacterium sp. CBMA 361]
MKVKRALTASTLAAGIGAAGLFGIGLATASADWCPPGAPCSGHDDHRGDGGWQRGGGDGGWQRGGGDGGWQRGIDWHNDREGWRDDRGRDWHGRGIDDGQQGKKRRPTTLRGGPSLSVRG